MKLRYYLILFSVLVCSSNLNAQNNLNKITGLSSTTASVAYSLRQLSTSYTGPLVRIKVGSLFYDVYPDATTYNFTLSSKISASISTYNAAVSAASANALSSIITAGTTNATVAIWYDQSGNAVNVLSSTSTARIITSGSINTIFGQPTVYFFDNNSGLGSSSTVDYSALSGATVNAVAQNVATTSSYAGIIGTGATPITYPGYNIAYSSPSSGYGSDGDGCFYGTSVTSTDIKVVTNIFINNTKNLSKIYVNGELKTNVAVTSGTCNLTHSSGSKIFIGASRGLGRNTPFIGNISEAIIFPSQLSDEVRNPLETNQTQTYLGPSVTITSSASGAVCAGTNVTFTASVSGISSPTYQWYKNNTIIVGANASTYSSTILSNNDQIKVYVNGGINNASIVSSGLKLNLDASNPSSYAGSGNAWYDLSGNNNHATLNNSPTYDAASGSIVTNGTNQYLSVPLFNNSITNVTMQTWVYITLNTKGAFIANGYGNGYSVGIGSSGYDNPGSNASMLFSGTRWITNTNTYTAGWHLVTMVLNGSSTPFIYVDNALQGSVTGYPGVAPSTPASYLTLGAIPGDNARYYAGKFAAAYFYDRALSLSEIQQNYNAFATKTNAYASNTLIVSISGSIPNAAITVNGDGCINKTSLTTTSGLSSYVWYKDNVIISGITTNTFIPNAIGDYKVVVSNGSCSSTSSATTIYNCGINADGKAVSIANTGSLISREGGAYLGTAKDLTGKMFNTTSLTTIGASSVGTTSVVLGGIISGTNGRSSGIGVAYSMDPNFSTFLTTSISTNVAAGTYTSTISGLASSTKYYAKSFIVNASGTNYGSVVDFTTTTPTIVTNGLILYLNANSYSSGNTWSDLSTQNNNATLVGSPTFSSNPNSFTLASNKYALTSNLISSLSSATFIAWVNPSETQADYTGIIFSRGPNSGASAPATGLNFFRNNSVGYSWNDNGSTWGWDSRLQTPLNAWSMVAVTINSTTATAYLCKASGITTAVNTVAHSALTGLKFYVGAEPFDFNNRAIKGKISTAMIYSSALSLSDITSIFNAQKANFGL